MKGSQSDASTATTFSVDKLSYEIFSILESKFLSGIPTKNLLQRPAAGRVRILSIDTGGATNGLLAAASITRLESSLQRLTSDPSARISDFFDVAAGAGTGGVLAALLFVSGAGGRPLFSAAEASRLLLALLHTRTPLLSRIFLYRKDGKFLNKSLLGRIFGELTLRDTVKPLLITCFDMRTRAPFLFSRAAALENQEFNFLLSDVCAATTGAAAEIMSVDRKTVVEALAGGVAVENPAAAAMTHVVNNRTEFPLTTEVEDLFVVSLGNGELTSPTSPSGLAGIVGQITADMVDQAVSTAFGKGRSESYVRIQVSMSGKLEFGGKEEAAMAKVEKLLRQKSVEAMLFRGRRVSERTNAEKLERTAEELIKEGDGRKRCPFPVVLLKQSACAPPLSLS